MELPAEQILPCQGADELVLNVAEHFSVTECGKRVGLGHGDVKDFSEETKIAISSNDEDGSTGDREGRDHSIHQELIGMRRRPHLYRCVAACLVAHPSVRAPVGTSERPLTRFASLIAFEMLLILASFSLHLPLKVCCSPDKRTVPGNLEEQAERIVSTRAVENV